MFSVEQASSKCRPNDPTPFKTSTPSPAREKKSRQKNYYYFGHSVFNVFERKKWFLIFFFVSERVSLLEEKEAIHHKRFCWGKKIRVQFHFFLFWLQKLLLGQDIKKMWLFFSLAKVSFFSFLFFQIVVIRLFSFLSILTILGRKKCSWLLSFFPSFYNY